MPFLNKKEQYLINMVYLKSDLSAEIKIDLVSQVMYNARLRSDGHKSNVRRFLTAISSHKTNLLISKLL